MGRALGDVMERSLAFYEGYFARRGIATRGLPDLVAPVVSTADAGLPEHIEVLRGNGGAQAIDSLPAVRDRPGIPRVLVSRHALSARDEADAVARAAYRARAGGYAHSFAFGGGTAFVVETTVEHSVLSGPGPHTNHYLDPALGEDVGPPSTGSAARYDRLLELLEEIRPDSPEGVMRVLRDHHSRPQAICLHPNERDGDDAETVVFSMVCDLEAGRMWVSPGNPCTTAYQEIDVTEIG